MKLSDIFFLRVFFSFRDLFDGIDKKILGPFMYTGNMNFCLRKFERTFCSFSIYLGNKDPTKESSISLFKITLANAYV